MTSLEKNILLGNINIIEKLSVRICCPGCNALYIGQSGRKIWITSGQLTLLEIRFNKNSVNLQVLVGRHQSIL